MAPVDPNRLRPTLPYALLCGVIGLCVAPAAAAQVGERLLDRILGPIDEPLPWASIEHCALSVDLTVPGRFTATAELVLDDVPVPQAALLLNGGLQVTAATLDGTPVRVTRGRKLKSAYHREGRVLLIESGAAPAGAQGSRHLRLDYSGPAATGSSGSDWRGILFVDAAEARMSEQTVFYPQVPLGLATPRVRGCRFALSVCAPAAWEVYAPLPAQAVEPGPEPATRRHVFAGQRDQVISVLGGECQRTEIQHGDLSVVTLLSEKHAPLASAMVETIDVAIAAYTERFGRIDAGQVGVVEIHCRDSSYNWASFGVIAMDTAALGGAVPVDTLAHEVAHLWWGQAVQPDGPGERFLTEGLAEYSAWTFLEDSGRTDALRGDLDRARRQIAELVKAGNSAALDAFGFDHPEYQALAYAKGPLVLRALRAQLDPGALDAALARLVASDAHRPSALADLEASLRAVTGLEGLAPCWFRQSGDLDIDLQSLEADPGGDARLKLRAHAAGASAVDPRGTPVRLQFGGPGWRQERTVLLQGELTDVHLAAGQEIRFARLDPAGAWPRAIRTRTAVPRGVRILTTDPPSGSTPAHGGDRLVLTFDAPVAPVPPEALRAAQHASADERPLSIRDIQLLDDGERLLLQTAPWYPDQAYGLDLSPLTDLQGIPLAEDAYRFRTAPSQDRDPPTVVRTVPPTGATVPPGDLTLRIEFSEPMLPAQGFKRQDVAALAANDLHFPKLTTFGEWEPDARTLVYTFTDLQPGTTYALPIRGTTFRDLSGNGVAAFDWTVTVGGSAD